jgi:magnesium-dependent phosphatase 1
MVKDKDLLFFNRFQRETGLAYNDMLFFDDEERNIHDLKKVGVHCVFVKKGVDMKLVKDALKEFSKQYNHNQ